VGVAVLLASACGRESSTPKLSVTTTPTPAGDSAPATQITDPNGPPQVVAFDPPLGATNVDPARTRLSVTFDRTMDPEGWAWVIEDKATAPDIGESSWDAAVRTNTTPVRLEPGKTYVVWINSPTYPFFKDPQGRTATPVRWSFTTRGAAAPPR
jgi:RNA polymerase sigma-70 factor (ECF subfamily)